MAQMRLSDARQRPLQTVYLDHVRVEAVVIDENRGEAGFPWLTLAFDALTRMVTGFHLTLAPPSRVSASLCLLHSVCDKTRWMNARGLSGNWPAAGLPETIVADSHSFFGLRSFARACRNQGVATISLSPRARAYGGFVAEMVGGRLGALPIAQDVGGAYAEEAPRHARGVAAQGLRDLERVIGEGIVNDYHRRRHDDIDDAPLDAWRAHAEQTSFRAPQDCLRFRLSFFPEQSCELREDGIHLLGETFWSPSLAQPLEEGQSRIAVKFDPRDLSRVFAQRPGGRFVKVNNISAPDGREECDVVTLATPQPDENADCRRKCHGSCPFAPKASRTTPAWSEPSHGVEMAALSD